MNRKLKFRVWDEEEKNYEYDSCFWIYQSGELDHDYKNLNKEYVIEQFTGLYDIKNKPIYENDILLNEDSGECYQVKWDDENACFYWDQDYFMGDNLNCMIVIGNTNENPQILSKIS